MFVLILVLLVGVSYYAHFRASRRRLYEMVESVPEIDGLPILGNTLQFIGGPERILRSIFNVSRGVCERGGVGKVWLGPKLFIVITNPEDAQTVLESCLQKDGVYRFLRPWLGDGLFIAPYELWKTHRRLLLPVFHARVIEEYMDIFGEQAGVLVERLSSMAGGGEFDVFKFITSCTLDIVFQTAMGERMDVQRSPESAYLRARKTVMQIINMRLFKVWLQPDSLFNVTPYSKQQRENIEVTHAFANEVIKRKRAEHSMVDDGETRTAEGPRSLLELLLSRAGGLSDEQLREHVDSITIAGNDTTALVIAYTLVLLGAHQHCQQRIYSEQKEIFGDSSRPAGKDDLMRMHELERAIKESMRLYTVVPIIARTADKDVQLSNCTIPAGAGCVIGACGMHRDPRVWGPDADKFDPDRFLPERSRGRHPCAFIPFSHGARNCIGRHFGMLVMKSILSQVIRNFTITSTHPSVDKLKIEIILFPIEGHQITIEKRQKENVRNPIRPIDT